jgi:hypothetical protein
MDGLALPVNGHIVGEGLKFVVGQIAEELGLSRVRFEGVDNALFHRGTP